MITIEIAKQFTSTPGGRFRIMGPDSGEEFRDYLHKQLREHSPEPITVVLDGVEGYGSSFLEEAFGGLVRLKMIPAAEALARVHILAKSRAFQTYAAEARQYMEDAARQLQNG